MSSEVLITIENCKGLPGESQGSTYDRLEEIVKAITEKVKPTPGNIVVLAYALMSAPSDFDYCAKYSPSPSKRVRKFFEEQEEGVRFLFTSVCKDLHRTNKELAIHRVENFFAKEVSCIPR